VPTSQGTTIVLDAGERTLWVTSPDDGALVQLDATTLVEVRRLQLGPASEPDLLLPVGGLLAVSFGRAPEVALVDPASDRVHRVPLPCARTRGLARLDPDEGAAPAAGLLVTCPLDDLLVEVDPVAAHVRRVVRLEGGPATVAVAGSAVSVSAARAGRVVVFDASALTALPEGGAVVDEAALGAASVTLEARPGRAARQGEALAGDPAGGIFAVAFQRVDHDADRGRDPARGGYGSVFDDQPRIEPMLRGPCGARYARFDGGPRAHSGPSALAFSADGTLLWVAHRYTDTVALLDCGEDARGRRDGEARTLATFRTGRGPRGIAVTHDGRTAFVDVGFDAAVARLRWDGVRGAGVTVREPEAARRRALGATTLSETARRGRALFHDAVDTHLTPSGVVTCATCHPGGEEDGLVWFLHTRNVRRKVRRTPPAWGARPALAPYHWDGEFTDARTLTRATIVELMEGDALLVDLDAIAAYLEEIPPPPRRPVPEGEGPLIARGAALFASPEVGCALCHVGPLLGGQDAHDVLEAAADVDARLSPVHVPPLAGVRTRAPYLHDGRAATLRDVLTTHNPADRHGRTSTLEEADLRALLAYLESL
jgi:cytochrome c553